MRHDDGNSVMTVIKSNLPRVRIALAALEMPLQHSMFQQLHNYPVGASGSEHKEATKGSKYNITPGRRSFLSSLKAYIAFQGNEDLETGVIDGLTGKRSRQYGLPFLGDNNFMIDRLEPVSEVNEAYWYSLIDEADTDMKTDNITRLTITIDRANIANTKSALFAPGAKPSRDIPEKAWVTLGY